MSVFPQRQSQKDFLAAYKALPDDGGDDDDGIDLLDDQLDDDQEEPDNGADLDGLIAAGDAGDEDESWHKQLDAARRSKEEEELQALARRFEERAEYEQLYDVRGVHHSSGQAKLAKEALRRREAQLRAEQAEHAAAEAKERELADAIKKRKREQLEALYHAFDAVSEPTPTEMVWAPKPKPTPAAPAAAAASAAATSGPKRFRIKKRSAT